MDKVKWYCYSRGCNNYSSSAEWNTRTNIYGRQQAFWTDHGPEQEPRSIFKRDVQDKEEQKHITKGADTRVGMRHGETYMAKRSRNTSQKKRITRVGTQTQSVFTSSGK